MLQYMRLRMFILILQVEPSETWLRDDCDGKAYFPQDGNFNLQTQAISEFTTLVVEGPSLNTPAARSNLPPTTTLTSTPSPSGFPGFRSVVAPKRSSSFSLKVLKAKMNRSAGRRNPEFHVMGQTYIEITDSTANLEYILGVITQRWGNGYTLVTSDGVPLEDSPTTQGTTYKYAKLVKYKPGSLQG